jgi:hypothetical protein
MTSRAITLSTLLLLFAVVPLFMGCDTIDDDGDEYTASLSAINTVTVPVDADGDATFEITDGTFSVQVEADGFAESITHAQHVHAAAECPPPSADTNGDGYIDVVEGVPFYGGILIPLDGDLSEQAAGAAGYPEADGDGDYDYTASTSFSTMLDNLTADDPNPDDPIVKLDGSDLNLDGRTIVVHGVDPDTDLPETVQTVAGLSPQASLPVACGSIVSD